MKMEAEYFLEEPAIDQELSETVKHKEYVKVKKRLRLISHIFQYLIPTLFVTIILLR